METEYKRHPMSHAFRKMTTAEFNNLVYSMQRNGFEKAHQIVLYEDQIVDGWHRYTAAKEAGVKPEFRRWIGKKEKLMDFIILSNSTRRQLSKGAHAQALIESKILMGISLEDIDQNEIARLCDGSMTEVRKQIKMREVNPEIASKVASGDIPNETAKRTILGEQKKKLKQEFTRTFSERESRLIYQYATAMGETPIKFVSSAIKMYIKHLEKQA